MADTVYFIRQSGTNSPVMISTNTDNMLIAYRKISSDINVINVLRSVLSQYSYNGEWFNIDTNIVDMIHYSWGYIRDTYNSNLRAFAHIVGIIVAEQLQSKYVCRLIINAFAKGKGIMPKNRVIRSFSPLFSRSELEKIKDRYNDKCLLKLSFIDASYNAEIFSLKLRTKAKLRDEVIASLHNPSVSVINRYINDKLKSRISLEIDEINHRRDNDIATITNSMQFMKESTDMKIMMCPPENFAWSDAVKFYPEFFCVNSTSKLASANKSLYEIRRRKHLSMY